MVLPETAVQNAELFSDEQVGSCVDTHFVEMLRGVGSRENEGESDGV